MARADSTRSIDGIADSLCLTPDQRVMLFSCTTMELSPAPLHLLVRCRTDDAMACMQRTMLTTSLGSLTMVSARTAQESWSNTFMSASLRTSIAGWTIAAGDVRMTAGRGLVFGAQTFAGSTVVNSAQTVHDARMQAWTSTMRTGYMRAVCVQRPGAMVFVQENGRPGGMAQWNIDRSTIGCTFLNAGSTVLASVFGTSPLGAVDITYEAAATRNGLAMSASCTVPLARGRIVVAPRYFTENFTSPFASTFAASSTVRNEAGLYVGAQWHDRTDEVTATCDVHWSLSRRYGIPAPFVGCDVYGEWRHTMARGVAVTSRLRLREQADGIRPADSSVTKQTTMRTTSARVDAEVDVLPTLRLRARLHLQTATWSTWKESAINLLAFSEVRWKPAENITLMARWSAFNAPSFDAAIYVVEDLLPGLMRSTLMMGEGGRWIASARWSASDHVAVAIAITSMQQRTADKPSATTVLLQTDVQW